MSELCLGTMMFGRQGNPDHEHSIRIIHAALEAGINFIDTADVYSEGESETIVGKALLGRRDDVVVATKFHNPMGDDPNHRGNSRRWIIRAVEASLGRLQTDWIDLYQVHRPDADTDIEETLSTLDDLRRQGKIRYFGTTTFPAHTLVEAQWVSRARALGRFLTEQPPYSMLVRGAERDVLPLCQQYGLGVLTWSPLAGGFLSGRYGHGQRPQSRRAGRFPARYDVTRAENQAKLEAAERLGELAEEAEMPLLEMAIAFVLQHPAVTSAIIGPRTMEHLEHLLPAVDRVLDDRLLDRIDEIVPPGTTFTADDAGGWSPPAITNTALRRR